MANLALVAPDQAMTDASHCVVILDGEELQAERAHDASEGDRPEAFCRGRPEELCAVAALNTADVIECFKRDAKLRHTSPGDSEEVRILPHDADRLRHAVWPSSSAHDLPRNSDGTIKGRLMQRFK